MSKLHAVIKPNTEYTRTEIQALVDGGELQSYLPQKDKVILAGCFAIDNMNPRAPTEVQVGNAPKVAAKAVLLSRQPETCFPVFLKQNRNDRTYKFAGYFRFMSLTNDPRLITKAEEESGRHGELAYLLRLQEA
jgi:hypothetical protein